MVALVVIVAVFTCGCVSLVLSLHLLDILVFSMMFLLFVLGLGFLIFVVVSLAGGGRLFQRRPGGLQRLCDFGIEFFVVEYAAADGLWWWWWWC